MRKDSFTDSLDLIERLAHRIMDAEGRGNPWKQGDMTYLMVHRRVRDMNSSTLARYAASLTDDPVDISSIVLGRKTVCEACFCGYECGIDHVANLTTREIMIHQVCQTVADLILDTYLDYFHRCAS